MAKKSVKSENEQQLDAAKADLAEKNKKIKQFFKGLRDKIAAKTGKGASEAVSYLKSLEKVAVGTSVVGMEMAGRGLDKVKKNIEAKVDNYVDSVNKAQSRINAKAEKANQKIDAAYEKKQAEVNRHTSKSRNADTKGAKAYSAIEGTGRDIRTKLSRMGVEGARKAATLGSFIKPNSKKMEKFVEQVGNDAAKSVRKETKLEKNVRTSVDKVHNVKDSFSKSADSTVRGIGSIAQKSMNQREEIRAGKYDRKGGSRLANLISRGIRLASNYKNEFAGEAKVLFTAPKAAGIRVKEALLDGKRDGKSKKAYSIESKSLKDAKDKASTSSKAAEKFDKAAEKVEGFGRNVSKGVTFAIGGVVLGARGVKNATVQKVEDMKRIASDAAEYAQDVIDEKVEQASNAARGAAKYVAEAPGKIENASRHGIGSLLNGISKRASDLAKKVEPKGKDVVDRSRLERGLATEDVGLEPV